MKVHIERFREIVDPHAVLEVSNVELGIIISALEKYVMNQGDGRGYSWWIKAGDSPDAVLKVSITELGIITNALEEYALSRGDGCENRLIAEDMVMSITKQFGY